MSVAPALTEACSLYPPGFLRRQFNSSSDPEEEFNEKTVPQMGLDRQTSFMNPDKGTHHESHIEADLVRQQFLLLHALLAQNGQKHWPYSVL